MQRFANLEITDNLVSALFLTKDVAEANMLKRAIMSEIETYAIDIVTFQVNTSARHDEIIALRLGQLVIDHSRFVPPETGDFKVHIDVQGIQGPGQFTTDDIPELPFKFKTPIMMLKAGHRIVCDVIVKRGQGRQHVKWRPVSSVAIHETEDGYLITFKEIGMLTGPEILERGLAKIVDAAHRPPITIFSRPLVPANIQ